MVKVAVDAMGGDNAPLEIVKGCINAVRDDRLDASVMLTGPSKELKLILDQNDYTGNKIEIINTTEVIETGESPVEAIRKKKDSSMVVGMKLVKDGKAEAFVSAGNSGALLVGGSAIVGRLPGVERTPLIYPLPTEKGVVFLLDCGANMDARPEHILQFARMGSFYATHMYNINNPRVAIVNVGLEEEKGNALVKETFPLLRSCKDINFIGSIEAREIPHTGADVVVCDAFVGNVILKLYEGTASMFLHKLKDSMMSSIRSKLGAMLLKPSLKAMLKTFDASNHGGAPLLGCKGLVLKVHGNAKAGQIHSAISDCSAFDNSHINLDLEKMFAAP